MSKLRLLSAICATLFLVPHTVFATSVWMSDFTSDLGSPIKLYLVTDINDAGSAATGQVLDFYFDFLSPADATLNIDPTALLTSSSASLAASSQFDIYHTAGTSLFSQFDSFNATPGNLLLITMITGYSQNYEPNSGNLTWVASMSVFDVGTYWSPTEPPAITPDNFIYQSLSSREFTLVATTVVPIPATIWLFVTGLLGFVGVARRAVRA